MTFELYSDVMVNRDVPHARLRRGDVVKLVEFHPGSDGETGYSVEVINAFGDALRVAAVAQDDLAPLRADEILCMREASTAAAAT